MKLPTLVCLLIAFTLLAVVGLHYVDAAQSRAVSEAHRLVAHTYDVRGDLATLLSMVKDAETGQRGYVITGDPSHLDPYHNAVRDLAGTLDQLRGRVADNPAQRARIDALAPRVAERMALLAEGVKRREANQTDAAIALVRDAGGKRMMDDLRARVAEIDAEEGRLMAERRQAVVRAEADGPNYTALEALLLAALIGAALFAWQARSLAGYRRDAGADAKPVGFDPMQRVGELEAVNAVLRGKVAASDEAAAAAAEAARRADERATDLALANRALEGFGDSVAHDLRLPVSAVIGFAQTVREQHAAALPASARTALDHIETAGRRMAHLIDDLQRLARLNSDPLWPQSLDLAEVARAARDSLQAQEPGRAVQWVIPARLKAQGDARFLKLVLENLLGNAWKFTRPVAAPRIEVGRDPDATTLASAGGVPTVAYFVRDNGVGFDSAKADQLFVPFKRLHRADEFPGTGLGLAIVQRVVHRHGGKLWAASSKGLGTTFTFTLPEVSAVPHPLAAPAP